MIGKRHIFDVVVLVVVAALGIGMIFSGFAFGPVAPPQGRPGVSAADFNNTQAPDE